MRQEVKEIIEKGLQEFCFVNRILFPQLEDALFPGRRSRPKLFFSLLKDKTPTVDVNNITLSIEFSHRASIILDDLIDNDLLRRRTKTFHEKHGREATILISHFLISSSFNLLNKIQTKSKIELNEYFYEAGKKMIIGEMADIGIGYHYDLECYFERLLLKTSSLYQLASVVSSIVNEDDDIQKELYYNIGEKVGSIYQMLNDIYDDVEAGINERGYKESWTFNLTFLRAIAYSYGDQELRNSLIELYNKKYLSREEYLSAIKLYKKPVFEDIGKRLINEEIGKLDQLLSKLENQENKNIFSDLVNKMKVPQYHNHYEFETVGY